MSRWTLSTNELAPAADVREQVPRGRRLADVLHLVEVVLVVLRVPALTYKMAVDEGRLLGVVLLVSHVLRLEVTSPVIVGVDNLVGVERADVFRV